MKTYIMRFDGQQGKVEFQSESVFERNVLLKIERLEPLTDSEQMAVAHWVESTLAKFGHRRCHLMGIEGSGHSFTFTAEQESGSLGNW
jgi:hypothetical protein